MQLIEDSRTGAGLVFELKREAGSRAWRSFQIHFECIQYVTGYRIGVHEAARKSSHRGGDSAKSGRDERLLCYLLGSFDGLSRLVGVTKRKRQKKTRTATMTLWSSWNFVPQTIRHKPVVDAVQLQECSIFHRYRRTTLHFNGFSNR